MNTPEFEKVIKQPYSNNDNKFKIPPSDSEKVYQTFCGT